MLKVTYSKVYTSEVGRKLHKNLEKKFRSRASYVKWLNENNVIVKGIRNGH